MKQGYLDMTKNVDQFIKTPDAAVPIKEKLPGYLAMIGWAITSAWASVYTGKIAASSDPIFLCFGTFLYVIIFFLSTRIVQVRSFISRVNANKKHLLIINTTTLCCWVGTIYPLKYIEPSIVNSIIFSSLPIATLLIGVVIYKNKNVAKTDFICASLLMLGIIYLGGIYLNNQTAIHITSTKVALYALLITIFSGIMLAANTIYTKKLVLSKFSPFDILASRFILITIVTGFYVLKSIFYISNLQVWIDMAIIATTFIILPQILFQYALQYLEPITVSFITPLMLIMVYLFEFSNKNLNPEVWSVLGVIYISLISLYSAFMRYKKYK